MTVIVKSDNYENNSNKNEYNNENSNKNNNNKNNNNKNNNHKNNNDKNTYKYYNSCNNQRKETLDNERTISDLNEFSSN